MPDADLVILNGRLHTMDPAKPVAEALAIRGNRILAVGSNADIRPLAGKATRIFDARGGSVTPGIIESHLHVFGGGAELDHCDLAGVRGAEAFASTLKAYLADRPAEPLIIANGADYTMLRDNAVITRHDLDAVVPDRPLLLFAADHHTAWANSIALEKGGILQGKLCAPGNEVVMAADGLALGELREGEAYEPVLKLSSAGTRVRLGLSTGDEPDPPATADEWATDLAIMRRSLRHLASHGITSFHNMDGNLYQLELLEAIDKAEGLLVRARIPFHFIDYMEISALEKASYMHQRYRGPKLSSGYVKMFMDGVIDSGTAWMLNDYADRPGWRSDPLFQPARFNEICIEADRRGLQIAVHSIGDRATRTVFDGYEAARKANGARDSRHRIEHVELIDPADIPRFAELGVIASMQPMHPPGCECFPLEPFLSRIGEARWDDSFPWRTILNTGAAMCFASDWPVCPVDPLIGLQAALTRPFWKAGLVNQRLTIEEAIAGYTVGGAYAELTEASKGRLMPGYLADIAVFSGNFDEVDPRQIRNLACELTICDGAVTHDRQGALD